MLVLDVMSDGKECRILPPTLVYPSQLSEVVNTSQFIAARVPAVSSGFASWSEFGALNKVHLQQRPMRRQIECECVGDMELPHRPPVIHHITGICLVAALFDTSRQRLKIILQILWIESLPYALVRIYGSDRDDPSQQLLVRRFPQFQRFDNRAVSCIAWCRSITNIENRGVSEMEYASWSIYSVYRVAEQQHGIYQY